MKMRSEDLFDWTPVKNVKIDGDNARHSSTIQNNGKETYFRLGESVEAHQQSGL